MNHHRKLVLAAAMVCTAGASSIAFAQAQAPGATERGAADDTQQNAQCDYDRVCAERARAASARSEEGAGEASVRSAERARRARRPAAPLATTNVNTTIRRRIGASCEFVASAKGSYRSRNLASAQGSAPLRDVSLEGASTVTCDGKTVRRESHHFALPRVASQQQLSELLHARLSTQVPGSTCAWGPMFDFHGGALQARAVTGSCDTSANTAALEGYTSAPLSVRGGGPVPQRAAVRTGGTGGGASVDVMEGDEGAGSGEPTSEDARVGTR